MVSNYSFTNLKQNVSRCFKFLRHPQKYKKRFIESRFDSIRPDIFKSRPPRNQVSAIPSNTFFEIYVSHFSCGVGSGWIVSQAWHSPEDDWIYFQIDFLQHRSLPLGPKDSHGLSTLLPGRKEHHPRPLPQQLDTSITSVAIKLLIIINNSQNSRSKWGSYLWKKRCPCCMPGTGG